MLGGIQSTQPNGSGVHEGERTEMFMESRGWKGNKVKVSKLPDPRTPELL